MAPKGRDTRSESNLQVTYNRPPDKRAYAKIIVRTSEIKHMLWVHKESLNETVVAHKTSSSQAKGTA